MTQGHTRKVEAAGLVLACGLAIGPAQAVMAGELGPTSSGSVNISVSVAPRLVMNKGDMRTLADKGWDKSFCMLAPSATGLYRLRVATQRGFPVNVSWQDGPHSSPTPLKPDGGEPFQARRNWSECKSALLGSSRLLITPASRPVSGDRAGTNSSEVLMLVAPE